VNRAIPIVILVVIVAGALFYFNGGTFPNLGSPGQGTTSAPIAVTSAQLKGQSQLLLGLQNNGQSSTKSIQVLSTCSPDYSECQSLNISPVTFVLPSGNSFNENLSIPQCSFAPYAPCTAFSAGAPVPGQTYYLKVSVSLDSGNPITLNVPATATGTTAMINIYSAPIQNDYLTLTNLNSASLQLFGNLSGRMSVTFTTDRALASGITASLLNKTSFTYGIGIRNTLVSASTGTSCGFNCPNIIQSGASTVTLSTTFSSVTTGVATGTYYLISINFQNYGSYYFWIKAGATITSSGTTQSTSSFSCTPLLSNLNVTISSYNAEQGKIDVIVKNTNQYAVTFWGIDPEPYAGTTIHVNQNISASTSRDIMISNPAFDGYGPGGWLTFKFYFIPAGANEQNLARQGSLCAVPIKLITVIFVQVHASNFSQEANSSETFFCAQQLPPNYSYVGIENTESSAVSITSLTLTVGGSSETYTPSATCSLNPNGIALLSWYGSTYFPTSVSSGQTFTVVVELSNGAQLNDTQTLSN
jgi:hypothetical protein